MYKAADRFLKRLPATRFWIDYAPLYGLKIVNSDEIFLDALAECFRDSKFSRKSEAYSDHDLGLIFLILARKNFMSQIASLFVDDIERRFDAGETAFSLSLNERNFLFSAILDAGQKWKKRINKKR